MGLEDGEGKRGKEERKSMKRKGREDGGEGEKRQRRKNEEKDEMVENGEASMKKKWSKSVGGVESGDGERRLDEEDKAMATSVISGDRSLSRFNLSSATRKVLEKKGITELFEIQAATLDVAAKGKDLIGRAKTGSGKTLAFVLPVVEALVANGTSRSRGRPPSVIVLAPTRELASQVYRDFSEVAAAHGLTSCCLYGGTPFGPQCQEIRSGLDIVVGTPGRVIDHLERETLSLAAIRHVILDEADEMLSMGFQEDVEKILESATADHQTLLFSATVPKWVKELSSKFLRKDAVTIDTVGAGENRTNTDITHLAISCPPMMRGDTLGDLVKVHAGTYGKCIVFCDTKKDVNELAEHRKLMAIGCAMLHGDIPQAQREATIEKYRSGKLRCLIATDVAARGLDIQGVDLVVQTHPPLNYETYIHRSGRTGRAGRKGVCVTFYSMREQYLLKLIEHKAGIKFRRVGPPSASDIVNAAAKDASKTLENIHMDNIDAFREVAKDLIEQRGPEESLAAALASMTGYVQRLQTRSILSCFEGNVAVSMINERSSFGSTGHAWSILRRAFSPSFSQSVKGMTLCKDESRAVFDIPENCLKELKSAMKSGSFEGIRLELLKELPELKEDDIDLDSAHDQLRERRAMQRGKWQNGSSNRGGGDRRMSNGSRGNNYRGGHRR